MRPELICLGDSLTFGLGVPHDARWTTLVGLRSQWKTVNLGICGDTTGGMLSRLAASVLPDIRKNCHTQTALFIMGGSNDIIYALSQREARANLGAMVHQVKHAGLVPIVGIPPPLEAVSAVRCWGNVTDFPVCARLLQEYGQWLAQFCGMFHVSYVDFRPVFAAPGGGIAAEQFLDGIHPNRDSHEKMAKTLLTALADMPGRRSCSEVSL